MKLLVLVIRSLTLMTVISFRQNEHLRGTNSSESLASPGFLSHIPDGILSCEEKKKEKVCTKAGNTV